MQMSHADFKITKKDLKLISWIKEQFYNPHHEDFQVAELNYLQNPFAVKGVVIISRLLESNLILSLKRFSMVTVGFVDVEHN